MGEDGKATKDKIPFCAFGIVEGGECGGKDLVCERAAKEVVIFYDSIGRGNTDPTLGFFTL